MATRLKLTLDCAREKEKKSSYFTKHCTVFYDTSFYLKDIKDEDNRCEAEQMVGLRKWDQVAMFGVEVSTGHI